jgi:hypothetical protein
VISTRGRNLLPATECAAPPSATVGGVSGQFHSRNMLSASAPMAAAMHVLRQRTYSAKTPACAGVTSDPSVTNLRLQALPSRSEHRDRAPLPIGLVGRGISVTTQF